MIRWHLGLIFNPTAVHSVSNISSVRAIMFFCCILQNPPESGAIVGELLKSFYVDWTPNWWHHPHFYLGDLLLRNFNISLICVYFLYIWWIYVITHTWKFTIRVRALQYQYGTLYSHGDYFSTPHSASLQECIHWENFDTCI